MSRNPKTQDHFDLPLALTEKWVLAQFEKMCAGSLSPAEYGHWKIIKETLIARREKLKPYGD